MALGTKLGIGIAVVAVGGAGWWGWHRSSHTETQVETADVTPVEGDQAASTVTLAPEPIRTEPPAAAPEPLVRITTAEGTGTLASPPPIGVHEATERSFRARTDPPAESLTAPEVASAAPQPGAPPAFTPQPPVLTERAAPPPIRDPIAQAASDKPAGTQPAEARTAQHVIQAGETYTSLAEKYLGSVKYAHLIAKANPGKDPRKLAVGSKVNIPPAPREATTTKPATPEVAAAGSTRSIRVPTESAPPVPPDRAYKVKPGESWNDLAQRFLGDQNRWPELYELNKDRVTRNPEALRSGTVIELPPEAKLTTKPS